MQQYRMLGKVYHPIQKYKFESKSQQTVDEPTLSGRCITQYKNTNLKAFESKSQLTAATPYAMDRCITQYKNTNLKANHNWQQRLSDAVPGVSPNTKIQI